MKRNLLIVLLCALTAFISCKKSIREDTYLMTVKEYKTSIPLAGVSISLYRCANYDNIFGCRSKSAFALRSTDENGEYSFTQGELNQATQGIILRKMQYWDKSGGQGERFMRPKAILNISLKARKSYPDTTMFTLSAAGEFDNAAAKEFRAPKDSTLNFEIFGNERNIISWAVFTKILKCHIYCPRDTLATGSFTVNPKKFEILNSTIEY